MAKSGIYCSIAVALLLLLSGALAYLWIDRSITASYSEDSVRRTAAVSRQLRSLLFESWKGYSKDVVLGRLKSIRVETHSTAPLKDEGNVIWYDDISFIFDGARLSEIGI